MDLSRLKDRVPVEPWTGIAKIPWHEPDFSARMLEEHLDQNHGAASRPFELIDRQVDRLHEQLFDGQPQQLLDLGCGPGFYAERLARRGHHCVGIDYSPAAIDYARAQAGELTLRYRLANLLDGGYGEAYSAALLLYGEFNAFPPADATALLGYVHQALIPGGLLVLEPMTGTYVHELGRRPPTWFTALTSVFSSAPHLCLHESHWHEESKASIDRYFVFEDGADEPLEYLSTHQAYRDSELTELLGAAGFTDIRRYPSLSGRADPHETGLFVLVAARS